MAIFVALLLLVCGGCIGWWLASNRHWKTFIALILCGVFAFIIMVFVAQTRQGWDAIGLLMLALLTVVPLELGGMIGAGLAAWRNRKAGT